MSGTRCVIMPKARAPRIACLCGACTIARADERAEMAASLAELPVVAASPSSGRTETAAPRFNTNKVLAELEREMSYYADQPLKMDFMGITRAWRNIIETELRSFSPPDETPAPTPEPEQWPRAYSEPVLSKDEGGTPMAMIAAVSTHAYPIILHYHGTADRLEVTIPGDRDEEGKFTRTVVYLSHLRQMLNALSPSTVPPNFRRRWTPETGCCSGCDRPQLCANFKRFTQPCYAELFDHAEPGDYEAAATPSDSPVAEAGTASDALNADDLRKAAGYIRSENETPHWHGNEAYRLYERLITAADRGAFSSVPPSPATRGTREQVARTVYAAFRGDPVAAAAEFDLVTENHATHGTWRDDRQRVEAFKQADAVLALFGSSVVPTERFTQMANDARLQASQYGDGTVGQIRANAEADAWDVAAHVLRGSSVVAEKPTAGLREMLARHAYALKLCDVKGAASFTAWDSGNVTQNYREEAYKWADALLPVFAGSPVSPAVTTTPVNYADANELLAWRKSFADEQQSSGTTTKEGQ